MKKYYIVSLFIALFWIFVMSAGATQHDMDVSVGDANTGVTVRAGFNAAIQALASTSTGATEPSTTYAGQLWNDTTNNLLKMRNKANDAWVILGEISVGSNTFEASVTEPVLSVSAYPYTILSTDNTLLFTNTGTVTFPQQSAVSSSTIKKEYMLCNIGVGTVTLAPFAGDTLPETSLVTGSCIFYLGHGGTTWVERKAFNAQELNGFTATATPTASKIAVANTDGTLNNWVTTAIRDNMRGLVIDGVTDNTIDVTIPEIVLQDNNGIPKRSTSISLTINTDNDWTIDGSVKNGLGRDDGDGVLDVDTWYNIWVVSGTEGTALVITVQDTLANVLANSVSTGGEYDTYGAYIGSIYSDATSDLVVLVQNGNRVRCKVGSSITVSATSATATDITDHIPLRAKMVYFTARTAGSAALYIHPVTFTAAAGNSWHDYLNGSTAGDQHSGNCPIESPQEIYTARATANFDLYFHGWEY